MNRSSRAERALSVVPEIPLQDCEQDFRRLRRDLEAAVAAVCPLALADRRDDFVQEAMLKVMRRVGDAPTRLNASYLRRVAYSTLIDELRRQRRRDEVSLEDTEDQGVIRSPRPGPDTDRRSREIRQALNACLEGLARPRRLAVILHLQGETAGAAASILGWGRKQVYNLIFRGLRDLRRCLAARGVTP